MDTNRFVAVLLGLFISVIMVGTVFVSTLSPYSQAEKTYENEGVPFALMDDNEHTMVIENVGGVPKYTVDGEIIETNPIYAFNNQSTVIYGEDGYVRVWKVGNVDRIRMAVIESSGALAYPVNLNNGDSLTITFDNTDIVYSTTDHPDITLPIKPTAYLSNTNDYTQMIKPVVNVDSIIYLAGIVEPIHNDNAQFISVCGFGTIAEDDLTFTILPSNVGSGVTVDVSSYEITTIDKGNGLKQIDDIAITFTMSDDTTHIGHFTYFIAPTEVEYSNPIYVGATLGAIFDILGLVAGIGVLILAVGYYLYSRW